MDHQQPAQSYEAVISVSNLEKQLQGLQRDQQQLQQELKQVAPGSERFMRLRGDISSIRAERAAVQQQLVVLLRKQEAVGNGSGVAEGGGAGAAKAPVVEDIEWLVAALQQQLQRWKQAWHGGHWKLSKHD